MSHVRPHPAAAPRRAGRSWPLMMLALGAAGLWLLQWATADHPLLGHGPVQAGLHVTATLGTALLFVLAGGRAVLNLGLSAGLGLDPTGLQRAIAYGLLTFAASAVVLSSFGFDITAVLATSAILTAAVGLAMQPTLGSLIAGVALHMDRVLRVGDTVVLNDRPIEIIRLDWRTAVGLQRDGTTVVIPNSRLCNDTLVIYHGGRPARADTLFSAPAGVPPQRVTDLVSELIADFPQVDAAFPVMVMVDGHVPDNAAVRYRARYWVRRVWDRPEISSEVLRRIWYAFQRHGIAWPASRLYEPGMRGALPAPGAGVAEAAMAALRALVPGDAAERLAEECRLLLYAPDERIALPAWCEGHALLLLSGAARVDVDAAGVLADATEPPPLPIQRLGPAARLRRTADALARQIGPYAEHAVRRAAGKAATLAELQRRVAREVEDPEGRARFLAEVAEEDELLLRPGHVLGVQRDATGRLGADLPARATGEVALLAVPPALAGLLRGHAGAQILSAG